MRRWPWLAAGAILVLFVLVHLWPPVALVEGVFWQPDRQTVRPHGQWQEIGARVLVVQWLVSDDRAWYRSPTFRSADVVPDWPRIVLAPWAAHIIAGLAARVSERAARADVLGLAQESGRIAAEIPLRPYAYFASVEGDPTMAHPQAYRAYLDALPRPLWVSVYTPAGEQPGEFVRWLEAVLPPDVTVLIQDGVGVGHNRPEQARVLADAAIRALGANRIVLIVEVFRPAPHGFRPALPWEVWPQFQAYRGLRLYVFDGPHYLTGWRLWVLKAWGILTRQHNPTAAP